MKTKNKIPPVGRPMSNSAIESRLKQFIPKRRFDSQSKPTLVIDGMNLAYQARYAYAKLTNEGKSVSIIFGMPQIVRGLVKQFRPEKIVIVWDGEMSPVRLKKLPTYKSHRQAKRTPEERAEFFRQVNIVQKLFLSMGIPQAYNKDIEGDDMIYMVAKRYEKLGKVIIVSADKDFKQLINYDVSVFNPRTKTSYDTFAFICDAGVELPQFVDFLCLVGDTSDDIPGYRGCGEKTAISFLKKYWSIKQYLKSKNDYPGLTDKDRLEKVYKKNRTLINLRYYHKKYNSEAEITYVFDRAMPVYNPDKFNTLCNKYNLKTFKLPDFQKTFFEI